MFENQVHGFVNPEALAGTEGIDTDQPRHRNTKKYERKHPDRLQVDGAFDLTRDENRADTPL